MWNIVECQDHQASTGTNQQSNDVFSRKTRYWCARQRPRLNYICTELVGANGEQSEHSILVGEIFVYTHINLLILITTHQQQRFNQMSGSIIGRIDEMGNRIDDLEKSISELMQQAGVDAKATTELEKDDK